MSLSYLTYKDIDKTKWDNCIQQAQNSLIYGYSFYLDAMSPNWHAIILNDYEAVMPLTWKRKWGIKYLYQPAFIQQSGIFFTQKISGEQCRMFIQLALQKFKFAETTFNFANHINWPDDSMEVCVRNNFVLNINRPYEEIYDNYDPSFTKSLRRIRKFDMLYVASINYHKTVELYKYLYGSRLPFFSGKSYVQFERICKQLFKDDNLIIRHARSTGNELLASVILLKDNNRIYNVISCITSKGKTMEANYFLYDRVINEYANRGFIFDFEGSDVEGIAAFYKKFNPENQPYPYIKYNNLPPLVKLFKK